MFPEGVKSKIMAYDTKQDRQAVWTDIAQLANQAIQAEETGTIEANGQTIVDNIESKLEDLKRDNEFLDTP